MNLSASVVAFGKIVPGAAVRTILPRAPILLWRERCGGFAAAGYCHYVRRTERMRSRCRRISICIVVAHAAGSATAEACKVHES
jgi:hypothetical protein